MEKKTKQLLKRLSLLGYRAFEIKSIVQEALGQEYSGELSSSQYREVIKSLEKYEQLGSDYLYAYSK